MEDMSLSYTVVYSETLVPCDLFYQKALSLSDPHSLYMKVGVLILPSQGGQSGATVHTTSHSDCCPNCCRLLWCSWEKNHASTERLIVYEGP